MHVFNKEFQSKLLKNTQNDEHIYSLCSSLTFIKVLKFNEIGFHNEIY